MKDAALQVVAGFAGVVLIYASAAAYRVAFGFDAPLGEAAIAGIVTISVGRATVAGVNDMMVRRATVQYQAAGTQAPEPAPPWTP